jgi:hypothetical protein
VALADGSIRVRMGIHTGAPTVTAEGYVGVDVHLGARVAALVAMKRDDLSGAVAHLTEALELSRRHSLGAVLPFAVEGAHELAATLLGATASLILSAGGVEGELRLEVEQDSRAALGDDSFDELHAAGARLGLEEAAERASPLAHARAG